MSRRRHLSDGDQENGEEKKGEKKRRKKRQKIKGEVVRPASRTDAARVVGTRRSKGPFVPRRDAFRTRRDRCVEMSDKSRDFSG